MKKQFFSALAATLLLASAAAHADIQYTFTASDLSGSATKDFSFTLDYADYVHTLGLNAVTPTASNVKSSLGFDVAYAGTWYVDNVWGFDDSNHGTNSGIGWFGFDDASFIFVGNVYVNDIKAPGTYQGTFSGNSNGRSFFANGTMTVTDTNAAVPEPSALALLGLGATGLCWTRRRRVARGKA